MSTHYAGKLYRAFNPIYAREQLSGRGAALYGGRFNPKGVSALYLSGSSSVGTTRPVQV
jgi:RES domain-containing protein